MDIADLLSRSFLEVINANNIYVCVANRSSIFNETSHSTLSNKKT